MVFVRNTYNKDDVSKICSVISPMIQCIQPLDESLKPEELNQVNGLNLKLAVGMFKRFNEGMANTLMHCPQYQEFFPGGIQEEAKSGINIMTIITITLTSIGVVLGVIVIVLVAIKNSAKKMIKHFLLDLRSMLLNFFPKKNVYVKVPKILNISN